VNVDQISEEAYSEVERRSKSAWKNCDIPTHLSLLMKAAYTRLANLADQNAIAISQSFTVQRRLIDLTDQWRQCRSW